jgi:hypothetical protein
MNIREIVPVIDKLQKGECFYEVRDGLLLIADLEEYLQGVTAQKLHRTLKLDEKAIEYWSQSTPEERAELSRLSKIAYHKKELEKLETINLQ